jgi:hypothetical protein
MPYEHNNDEESYERQLRSTEVLHYFIKVIASARGIFPPPEDYFELRKKSTRFRVRVKMDAYGRLLIGAYLCRRLDWREGVSFIIKKLAEGSYEILEGTCVSKQ